MGIKEEFEKAFDDYFIKSAGDAGYSAYRHGVKAGAEWGAKWMKNYLRRNDISKELE